MKNPLISIVIPVYNAELYLCKCIDSIISQTLDDWELLLVDDGSVDASYSICNEYAEKDTRIKAFHKKNGGVSSARNLGILNAQGKYITFIDSDDWVSSTYLADFDIENICSDRALVLQGIRQYNPYKDEYNDMFSYSDASFNLQENPEDLYDKKLLINGCPVAKLFVSHIIKAENLLFNEKVSLNEDHLFFFDYLYHVDTVITKKASNYSYLYDFQVPSLTKKRHPAEESIIVAKALYKSVNKILAKYSLGVDLSQLRGFGPHQLIRASVDCYAHKYSYRTFVKVVGEYKEMVKGETIAGYDLYSKAFVYFVNKISPAPLFVIQYMCRCISNTILRSKFYIKRLMFRNQCSSF